jgi:hypothetical protein
MIIGDDWMGKSNIIILMKRICKDRGSKIHCSTNSTYKRIYKELSNLFFIPNDIELDNSFTLRDVNLEDNSFILEKDNLVKITGSYTSNITEFDNKTYEKFIKLKINYNDEELVYIYNNSGNLVYSKTLINNDNKDILYIKEKDSTSFKLYKNDNDIYKCLFDKKFNRLKKLSPKSCKITTKSNVSSKVKDKYLINSYYYHIKDNLIYTVDNLVDREGNVTKGICFKKLPKKYDDFLPVATSKTMYKDLENLDKKSCLLFRGYTVDFKHHYLSIYKVDDKIKINYTVEKVFDEPDKKSKILIDDIIELNSNSSGLVTSNDIELITNYLNINYNNIFINNLNTILDTYSMILSKSLEYEEGDNIFNSINCLDMDFSTIRQYIKDNKDQAFLELTNSYTDISRRKILHK